MTSTCPNSTRESNSSHTCVPLSKMPISLAHGIIRSSVLLIFFTASFVGNIVLALVLQRKPHLVQVTNRFIFNLLVTDLLQISLVAPWVVATSVPIFWPLNSHFCTALVCLTHLFAFASVNTIVVVSVDRYLSIIHPLSYPSKMTPRRGYMLLYGTWILAILQSTPPLYGWGQATFDQRNALCSMIWGASPSYTILSVVSFIIIPLAVMIACYSVVFSAARRQHALLYNAKSHSLEVRAKDRVENENEEGEAKDASSGQHGGEVNVQEGGAEAEEGSVESSAGGAAARGSKEVGESRWEAGQGSVEGEEDGTATGSVTADKGRIPEDQCNIDLGEDDMEFGEEDINFGEEDINFGEDDIEAVNIPESLPPSHRNSTSDPPLPRCYQCKAAKVIFLIIFSYVLSLGPYCFLAVLAVWVDVQTEVPQWAITIIIWLFFLQCCIHPYIYGYMHKTIKKEIQDMLKKVFCKEKPPKEASRPDLPGTEAGTEGGTEGKIVPSRDSAILP
ncbi:probable G-protein coupled receptor 101 [Meles meles]|uniref:probable G-protein coupled receptor 101 n=1 Tax=Meles meles TaxID=9662 RepID=UPI001E69CD42|nr:probable G-protein coupled receptor 101 [Meles meles]